MSRPAKLPRDLPVFPLTGSLLLPDGLLPLHIFEPRYRHMIEDALGSHEHIGMIQPKVPNPGDERGEGEPDDRPELYHVGCAGVIEQHQTLPFGRYLVVLRGVCRFRVERELPLERGYRRVEADYEPYLLDLDGGGGGGDFDSEPLLAALTRFSLERGVEVELERLGAVPPATLLNGLAMSLPLAPVEKQALLEAEDAEARLAMLLTLLEMGLSMDETPTLTN